jgi:hypothetical protein
MLCLPAPAPALTTIRLEERTLAIYESTLDPDNRNQLSRRQHYMAADG